MHEKPDIYAIDFGTSNSLLVAASPEKVFQPIPIDPNAADPTVFRSILFFTPASGWSFGSQALSDYVNSGMNGRFLRSIKRFLPMRSFEDTLIGSRRVRLEELVGIFLREMRLRANRHFGTDVKRVLLGRPAQFSDDQALDNLAQERLLHAAAIAGFETVEFCAEPLAAAYDFRAQITTSQTILVADFGGGTSDYTVMQLHPNDDNACQVLAMGGIALAGDALDGMIMRHKIARHLGSEITYRAPFGANLLGMPRPLLDHICSPAEICLLQKRDVLEFLRMMRGGALNEWDRTALDQLLCVIQDTLGFQIFEAIEETKCELSSAEHSIFKFEYPGIEIREPIARDEIQHISEATTSAILARMDQTIRAAGIEAAAIDWVCCTGGTAKVPAIAEGIRQRFGGSKIRSLASFHSVIQGLGARARSLLCA